MVFSDNEAHSGNRSLMDVSHDSSRPCVFDMGSFIRSAEKTFFGGAFAAAGDAPMLPGKKGVVIKTVFTQKKTFCIVKE